MLQSNDELLGRSLKRHIASLTAQVCLCLSFGFRSRLQRAPNRDALPNPTYVLIVSAEITQRLGQPAHAAKSRPIARRNSPS